MKKGKQGKDGQKKSKKTTTKKKRAYKKVLG